MRPLRGRSLRRALQVKPGVLRAFVVTGAVKKRSVAALVVASLSLGVGAAVAWANSSLIVRRASVVDDLPIYGDELRALPPYRDSSGPDEATLPGAPGRHHRLSPDGKSVAVTTGWDTFRASFLLGFVSDLPFIHSVGVWDLAGKRLAPVVSIKESDPWSGSSHLYAWSKDSQALLIHGSGGLPENDWADMALCLVYIPKRDQLFRLQRCGARS